jgi:hypothetical protein
VAAAGGGKNGTKISGIAGHFEKNCCTSVKTVNSSSGEEERGKISEMGLPVTRSWFISKIRNKHLAIRHHSIVNRRERFGHCVSLGCCHNYRHVCRLASICAGFHAHDSLGSEAFGSSVDV